MNTDNLQEMIQQNEGNPIEFNEPDYICTLPKKKLMYSDVKNEALNAEKPATESSITKVEVIPESSTTEVNIDHYQPESEEALIDYVNSQNSKLEMATILVKWEIGRSINSFYKGKYGAHELERISKETGIGTNSLHKMCRFARIYTAEQLQSLLKGNYTLTWFDIAQNLAVEPVRMIQTFELSKSYDDLLIQIKRLKDPYEKRGKSKLINRVEAKAMDIEKPEPLNVAPTGITVAVIPEKVVEKPITAVLEIISEEESMPAEYDGPADDIDPNELAQQSEAYAKELETLRDENERLKKLISDKDQQIDSMNAMMKENDTDIKGKDLIIATYRDRIKRVRYMIENNFGVGKIMELLVTVV